MKNNTIKAILLTSILVGLGVCNIQSQAAAGNTPLIINIATNPPNAPLEGIHPSKGKMTYVTPSYLDPSATNNPTIQIGKTADNKAHNCAFGNCTIVSNSSPNNRPTVATAVPTNTAHNPATQPLPQTVTTQQKTSSPLCAPEALKVGIKHFRYSEVDRGMLVASGHGKGEKFKIHKNAKTALDEMVAAAKKEGVTLSAGSIFRGIARQREIVNNKKSKGQSAAKIYRTSSHPGYSEHHTGLAVDFSPINDNFANTAAYRWLRANAHKFGFKQTFTAQYSKLSGIAEESWHWRFEGKNGEFKHLFAHSDALYTNPHACNASR